MPKLPDEEKQALMKAGKWVDFVKYRDDLKKSGVENKEAHARARAKFLDVPVKKRGGRPKGSKNKPKKVTRSAGDGGLGEEGAELQDVPKEVPSSPALSEPIVRSDTGGFPPMPPVRVEDFEGKVASEVEVVRWVADNMQVTNPKPKECPSAAAWGLLAQCRESMQARSDFWKLTYAKLLPSRAEMEKKKDGLPDESIAVEIIEDLLKFKERAEEVDKEEEPVLEEQVVGWKEGEF